MSTERPLDPALKSMLLANQPFSYAHLIKFERPSRPDSNSGQVSTSAQKYAYFTDASKDVPFDDGSLDQSGNANGSQTYSANKVVKVSAVQEDTEAKASNFSIVLDGNGLGAIVTDTVTIALASTGVWDITWPIYVDLIRLGFREGDKVTLSGLTAGTYNIVKFRGGPNQVRIKKIDTDITLGIGSLSMQLSSDEIVSILLDKTTSQYASFINREVFIYRAYFQQGDIVGAPFLLFKGIISGVSFDDSDRALTVTWNLTSHWGDFAEVKGRLTSDDFHRALDQNGVPQPGSAVKVSYAYDKGFTHAETSVNLLATYTVAVQKQDVEVHKGFLGIGSKVKVKTYTVNEPRNSQLDFQLQAKSIPVIYGVRNTEGIPVFADTLNSDSSTVYVAHALSEGEIGGIYDAYIENNSLICNDKADSDVRSVQTSDNAVTLICRGRADRGDVLGGAISINTDPNSYLDFYDTFYSNHLLQWKASRAYDLNSVYNFPVYIAPVATVTDYTGAGVVDGQSIFLTIPQNITLDVFSGKPGQKAAASLVTIAKANNFKIQNSYWNGIDTADYWGPNHRLLDTAYVVGKYIIQEGETTIPSIQYVVRGKVVDCYNYDKSYNHYIKATGEDQANFVLGDIVSLKQMDGTIIASNVQIIDKWKFANTDGTINYRFRFSVDPALGYINSIPSITKFQMIKGASSWTMITFNYREVEGTVPFEHITPITGAVNSSGFVEFDYATNSTFTVGGDPTESSSIFSVVESDGTAVQNYFFGNAVLVGTVSSTALITKYAWTAAGPSATAAIMKNLVRRNIITLPSTASSINDFYDGFLVTLTRVDPVTGKKTVQTNKIIDYNGANRIATIDGLWDYGRHPKVGDIVSLTPAYADARVSINPAIQLMDYISSTTYGRGLDVQKDLNFSSWLSSAQYCDGQSNITVQTTGGSLPSAADVYKYPATGNIIWQGQVVGIEGDYTEFTNVLGKLTNFWNNWKSYNLNELVYADSNIYLVTTAGVKNTKPTHTSGTTAGLQFLSSINLTKVSGAGPSSLPLVTNGNPVRALKNGSTISGYSLYDSDGVNYFRLLGWDEASQRYVTRHQTNLIIDTSVPLFDNVNSFLEHFGGIMRYTGGQYYLEVEQTAGSISNNQNEAYNITSDHIIGKIRLIDDGIKNAYNSLTAAYLDPGNKFESRNISFFNSDYLKADRNVPKKGNLSIPGITNYYNTRILADKYLNKSRFGLAISFNMVPRGEILLAGRVIQLQYPRYGWVDKKFRINTLTHQEDCSVDIVATEYDDSFYSISNITKQAGTGLSGNEGYSTSIASPTNLIATNTTNGTEDILGIQLFWDNNPTLNGNKNAYTEIYASYSPNLFLTITNIASNVLTSSIAHGLKINEPITITSGGGPGLGVDQTYYISTIPTTTTFTLSLAKGGTILGLTNDSSPVLIMNTARLIDTLPVSTNTYVDIVSGVDSRIQKYYWLRHKVLRS
jgi:hypothetical protein